MWTRRAFFASALAWPLLPPLPLVEAEALFFGGISLVVDPCGATYEALMTRAEGVYWRSGGRV